MSYAPSALCCQFQEKSAGKQDSHAHTNEKQQPVDVFRLWLGIGMQIVQKVFPEKEIKSGNGGARQQEIFRYPEKVSLRQTDERPMTKEKHQKHVHFAGKQ